MRSRRSGWRSGQRGSDEVMNKIAALRHLRAMRPRSKQQCPLVSGGIEVILPGVNL